MTKISGWDEVRALAMEVREKLAETGAQVSAELKEQWQKIEPHVTKLEERAMAVSDKVEAAADKEITQAVDKVREFREHLRARAKSAKSAENE